MYRIIETLDGRFLELCTIQDGTERHYHDSRQKAIDNLILGAKVMNGTIITEADIRFGKEHQVVRTEVIWEKPPEKHCSCCKHN